MLYFHWNLWIFIHKTLTQPGSKSLGSIEKASFSFHLTNQIFNSIFQLGQRPRKNSWKQNKTEMRIKLQRFSLFCFCCFSLKVILSWLWFCHLFTYLHTHTCAGQCTVENRGARIRSASSATYLQKVELKSILLWKVVMFYLPKTNHINNEKTL